VNHGRSFVVLSASSFHEAPVLVRDRQVDVVVCAHQGPGSFDGIGLLHSLPRPEIPTKVVLYADESRNGDMVEALESGCQMFVSTAVPIDRFCESIFQMLQPERGFCGSIRDVRLEDFLEMLCFRKESTHVYVSAGRTVGHVYVYDGAIVHAECGRIVGKDALFELLGAEGGAFFSQTVFDVPRQTIFSDWQSLLMEGVRQKDEVRHALGPEPSSGGAAAASVDENAAAGQPPEPHGAIRILVVDDSRLIRKIVNEILESDPTINVAGYAANGVEAIEAIDEVKPDLVLLDWDMPVMTGSAALMRIMVRSPCPVVILSGFDGGEGATPFDLLCLGAADFVRKPQSRWRTDGRADDLIRRVKRASRIKLDRLRRIKAPQRNVPGLQAAARSTPPARLVSIFFSGVGGAGDLIRTVCALPTDLPSALVLVHDMQPEAVGAFVDYLGRRSSLPVVGSSPPVEQREGLCVLHSAVAPLEVRAEARGFVFEAKDGMNGLPGVDSFLQKAAALMGRRLLVGLLSGAAGPTPTGLHAVKSSGGIVVAQTPVDAVAPETVEKALAAGVVDRCWDSDLFVTSYCDLVLGLRAEVGSYSMGGGRL
jgi:two-component system chemotaxis response regulator CheB